MSGATCAAVVAVGLASIAGPRVAEATAIVSETREYLNIHHGFTSNTPVRIVPQVGNSIIAVELPRFDPSLGTLESASLTIGYSNAVTIDVSCRGPLCFSNGQATSVANIALSVLSTEVGLHFGPDVTSRARAEGNCFAGVFALTCSDRGAGAQNVFSHHWSFSRAAGDDLSGLVGTSDFPIWMYNHLAANSTVDGMAVGTSVTALHSGLDLRSILEIYTDDGLPGLLQPLGFLVLLIDEALGNQNANNRGLLYSDAEFRTQFRMIARVNYEYTPVPEVSTLPLLALALGFGSVRAARRHRTGSR